MKGLLQNIYGGFRLAFFRAVGAGYFVCTLPQLVLLFLLSAGLNIGHGYLSTAPENSLNISGIYYQATLYLLFFFSAVLLAAICRCMHKLQLFILQALSITPTTFLVYALLLWVLQHQQWLVYGQYSMWLIGVYLGWYLCIVFRIIRSVFSAGYRTAVFLIVLYGLFNVVPSLYLPYRPVWQIKTPVAPATINEPVPAIDYEHAFFSQEKILARSTGKLLPQRANVVDLYFLGFAGYAAEDVFMNEAVLVKQLFDNRFDTAGRSVLLVNNAATVARYPLASAANLERVLAELGRLMDPEEDVLFLFLTSHGSEDRGVQVSLGEISFSYITPAGLAGALDRAGIRWRVIVISACFSGQFLAQLENESSMIITAANRDKSSFGCGHDGNFTYFGEAFFARALQGMYSFEQAFDQARSRIEIRETEEGLEASEPQLYTGKKIVQPLQRLYRRLQDTEPPVEPLINTNSLARYRR